MMICGNDGFLNHGLHFHLQCLRWSLRWRVCQSPLLYKYLYTGIIILIIVPTVVTLYETQALSDCIILCRLRFS